MRIEGKRYLHLEREGLVTIHELFFMYFQSIHASNLLDDRRSPVDTVAASPLHKSADEKSEIRRQNENYSEGVGGDLILRWSFVFYR